jgi:DNA-binding IscR family transcriptional regulator
VKSDFIVAVHAMVYLTHMDCLVSSDELAKNICTNPARVRKIMGKLKASGLVNTKGGHVGGYCTEPGAEKTTLLQIADCLGISFVDTKWHSGTEDMKCFISSGMGKFFDKLYEEMDQACREKLKNITLETITLQIVRDERKRTNPCHGETNCDCPAWEKFNQKYGR